MYDAKSFIYNGKCSDDFNIIIGFFDNADYVTGLERETMHTERTITRSRIKYYGSKYVNGITFRFSIIKKNENEFTEEESLIINEWLTENNTPTLLHFNSHKNIYTNYYAVCTNIEDVVINGRNAKTLTFETDSPFAYSNVQRKKVNVNGETKVRILNQSSEKYYPKIRITPLNNLDTIVSIENESDNNSVTIDMSNHSSGILIDGENCRVTDITNDSLVSISQIGWDNTNSIYFPRLLRGINNFKILGNCTVEFIMEFPRKVGSI